MTIQLRMYTINRGSLQLALSYSNDDAGIRALLRRLAYYRLARIVLEATGRREQALVSAALERQMPVIVVNPIMVRRFAGALGMMAKTDAIDARVMSSVINDIRSSTSWRFQAFANACNILTVTSGDCFVIVFHLPVVYREIVIRHLTTKLSCRQAGSPSAAAPCMF